MASIAEIAADSPDFDILLAAIGFVDGEIPSANLAVTLDTATDLTVFAPTDAAFTDLAVDLGYTGDASDEGAVASFLVTSLDAETLLDTILYHVSAGEQSSAEIAASASVTTLNGAAITPDGPTLGDLEPDLIDASIVTPDVAADNGVVHVIDKVMLPFDVAGNDAPTIFDFLTDNGGAFDADRGDFDILLQAVRSAELTTALDDAGADLTVFAPTDAAFVRLARDLGYENRGESGAFDYIVDALTLLSGGDPIPLLTDILLYHVAPESLQASQVVTASEVQTLLGVEVGVTGTQLVDADPGLPDASIIATDIQASNGVVHVIDKILIPTDLLVSDGTGKVDVVIGDRTDETIATRRDADLVSAQKGDDAVFLGDGNDLALGGGGDDTLKGGNGDDTLIGEGGNDKLEGSDGNDELRGEQGDDLLNGRDGNDLLRGGNGNDEVNGGSGDDILRGLNNHDILRGGDGEDLIDGGSGDDTVRGGNDADTFVFSAGADKIIDFEAGVDTLLIDSALISDLDDLDDVTGEIGGYLSFEFGNGNQIIMVGVTGLAAVADDIGLT